MHTVAYMVLMISAVYGFFDSFAGYPRVSKRII
jgi:hypothetical protein